MAKKLKIFLSIFKGVSLMIIRFKTNKKKKEKERKKEKKRKEKEKTPTTVELFGLQWEAFWQLLSYS